MKNTGYGADQFKKCVQKVYRAFGNSRFFIIERLTLCETQMKLLAFCVSQM